MIFCITIYNPDFSKALHMLITLPQNNEVAYHWQRGNNALGKKNQAQKNK